MHRWMVFAFLTGAMLMACTIENGIPEEPEIDFPYIEFDLIADGLSTRTVTGNGNTTPTTDPFTEPEKVMNTVDIFFYALSDGEDATAKHYYHIDATKHQTTHKIKLSESLRSNLFGTDNKCKVYTVVNVPDEDFAAASVTKSSATIKQLKSLKASTPTFAKDFNGFAMFTKAENGDEVTYSETDRKASGTLRLKNLAAKIDLFVHFADPNEVKGVDPTDPDSVEKSWTVWQPATAEGKNGTVEVYIVNGVTVVPLVGWTSKDYEENKVSGYLCSDDYYDLRSDDGKYARSLKASSLTDYPYIIDGSLYSYPNQWTTDMLEQHQTYLLMKVNWLPDDFEGDEPVTTDLLESYYKIPINLSGDSENKLLSNRYYRVKVNINTLGGMNFGAPLELDDCSWEVLPWGSTQLDADIHEIRWLEVDNELSDIYDDDDKVKYAAVMYNTTSVTIPYQTTHNIYLKSVKIEYWNFKTSDYTPQKVNVLGYRLNASELQGTTHIDDGTSANYSIKPAVFTLTDDKIQWFKDNGEDPNGVYIDEENHRITFYHAPYPLFEKTSNGVYSIYTNSGNKVDKPYSPFFIELVFAHVDKADSERIVRIKQYPGVYVTFTYNDGKNYKGVSIGRRVSNGNGTSTSGDNGDRLGVYINGGATDTFGGFDANDPANSLQLGGIGGEKRSSNKNMYSIHVVQLSDDDIMRNVKFGHTSVESTRDVQFHVGDPRTKFVNRYLVGDADLTDTEDTRLWEGTSYSSWNTGNNTEIRNAFRKVPAVTGDGNAQRLYHPEERTLRYYYPTNESQDDEHAFMVAPVFRMSSGATDPYIGTYSLRDVASDNLLRENARRRCAALQENGYPAGRWRIPTIGEMLFFRMLQKKNVLPEIFGKDGNEYRSHWTAQYLMKFDKDGSDVRMYAANDSQKHKWVRCVYDDWYWVKDDDNKTPDLVQNNKDKIKTGVEDNDMAYKRYYGDEDIRTMFVWGDKEKNNPQEQPNN